MFEQVAGVRREDLQVELAEVDRLAGGDVAVPDVEPVGPSVAGHLQRVHGIAALGGAGGYDEVAPSTSDSP